MSDIKIADDSNHHKSIRRRNSGMNLSRMTKMSKKILRMDRSLYASYVLTRRQLRTMVLSGCTINFPVVIGLISKNVVINLMQFLIWWPIVVTII